LAFALNNAEGNRYGHQRSASQSTSCIFHRDLKSANILLDQDKHCKLSDFGLAIVKNDALTKTGVNSTGTLPWMAPEIFSLRPKFSTNSDVYAFGIIMWEIATQRVPYQRARPEVISSLVMQGEREDFPEGCPAGYVDLMQKCWDGDHDKRPSLEEILQAIDAINPDIF